MNVGVCHDGRDAAPARPRQLLHTLRAKVPQYCHRNDGYAMRTTHSLRYNAHHRAVRSALPHSNKIRKHR